MPHRALPHITVESTEYRQVSYHTRVTRYDTTPPNFLKWLFPLGLHSSPHYTPLTCGVPTELHSSPHYFGRLQANLLSAPPPTLMGLAPFPLKCFLNAPMRVGGFLLTPFLSALGADEPLFEFEFVFVTIHLRVVSPQQHLQFALGLCFSLG